MACLLQTSQGDIVIDLHTELAPQACKNFLKLCKCAAQRPGCTRLRAAEGESSRGGQTQRRLTRASRLKYYNGCCFFNVQKDFIIQAGDPTNTGKGGESLNKHAPAAGGARRRPS